MAKYLLVVHSWSYENTYDISCVRWSTTKIIDADVSNIENKIKRALAEAEEDNPHLGDDNFGCILQQIVPL